MKNPLFIFCCFFLNTMYAQTDMGTLEGELRDKSTQLPLPIAYIYVEGLDVDTILTTDADGKYELQLKAGEYQVKSSYLGYKDTKTTAVVKPNEVCKHISKSESMIIPMPFETPGEAIDDLYGSWIVVYVEMNGKKNRQRKQIGKSVLSFSELKEEHQSGLGRISYNDGCNGVGSYWFKHSEDGKIEMKSPGLLTSTLAGCPEKYRNVDLVKGISKMVGHFEVQFMENDEILIKNDAVKMRLKRQVLGLGLDELFGEWQVDYIKYGRKKTKQVTRIGDSGITLAPHKMQNQKIRYGRAILFYNSGCNISEKSYIKHKGNGVIHITTERNWRGNKRCKNFNTPLVERARALMGGFTYKLKDENTLIIKTNKRNYYTKKCVKMQLIRVK